MQPFHETIRPATLDDVAGQARAVAACRRYVAAGAGGRAYWLSAPSGTGKTTLARLLAYSVADPSMVVEYDSGDDVDVDELARIRAALGLYGYGPTGLHGRAWIVNEAHGLRDRILRGLMGVLERIPPHVLFAFTTTRDGAATLFDSTCEASPLVSRCEIIPMTVQGFREPAAAWLVARARQHGLCDLAEPAALARAARLIKEANSSLRAAAQAVGAGALLAAAQADAAA